MADKLEKLNEEIKTLEGNSIAGFTPGSLLTYRKALISICEMFQPTQPGRGESLRAYDLGIRILKSKDSIILEKTDLDFLKKIVSESRVFVSIIIGRVNDYLKEIDKAKVED